jgi:hypothetical protein
MLFCKWEIYSQYIEWIMLKYISYVMYTVCIICMLYTVIVYFKIENYLNIFQKKMHLAWCISKNWWVFRTLKRYIICIISCNVITISKQGWFWYSFLICVINTIENLQTKTNWFSLLYCYTDIMNTFTNVLKGAIRIF